jgi:hypothetical protein
MKSWQVLGVVGLVGATMVAGGCGGSKSGVQALDLTLQASPVLNQPGGGMKTVEVNIVGVPGTDVDIACGSTPSKWFSSSASNESMLRGQLETRGLVKKLTFKTGSPATQLISTSDPFWEAVKSAGVRDLLIIADPPFGEGGDGTQWRKCIRAEPGMWVGNRVTITVGEGVTAATLATPKR